MIAQDVNLMNFLKGPKQFIILAYQNSPAIKHKLIPPRNTKEMIEFDAIMDASTLPDFCICALFYAQTFEKSVDNGG